MLSEEDNFLDTVPKIISYREAVHTGNGGNNALSNQSPQECVEAPQKTITRHFNHDCFQRHSKVIPFTISVSMKIIPWRRCSSHISHTLGYGNNVN